MEQWLFPNFGFFWPGSWPAIVGLCRAESSTHSTGPHFLFNIFSLGLIKQFLDLLKCSVFLLLHHVGFAFKVSELWSSDAFGVVKCRESTRCVYRAENQPHFWSTIIFSCPFHANMRPRKLLKYGPVVKISTSYGSLLFRLWAYWYPFSKMTTCCVMHKALCPLYSCAEKQVKSTFNDASNLIVGRIVESIMRNEGLLVSTCCARFEQRLFQQKPET